MLRITLFTLSVFWPFTLISSHANGYKPAILYGSGGKFDKSYNQSAYEGIERFKFETNIAYREDVSSSNKNKYGLIEELAKDSTHIILVSFEYKNTLDKIASKYPEKTFTIIDASVDKSNVESILFKEHEGSFIVGMMASLMTKSGKIGFIGGKDSPAIRKFEVGFREGAEFGKSNIKILSTMVGTTSNAWNNPKKGYSLAEKQIKQGVDIIFAAAGGTGLGVYEAAVHNNIYAIGVDTNQNYLYPGHMLTSMVKRVDLAVYKALKRAKSGNFKPGIYTLGLKEKGVSYAIDQYNKDIIPDNIIEKIEITKHQIVSKKIKVTNYIEKLKNLYQ